VLLGIGLVLAVRADYLFKNKKTTVKPFQGSSALVTEGPFRFSRHPMYLGMTFALAGVSVLLGSLSSFIAPVGFCITMQLVFIAREEKDMENVFCKEYKEYKKNVRQWL